MSSRLPSMGALIACSAPPGRLENHRSRGRRLEVAERCHFSARNGAGVAMQIGATQEKTST